MPIREPSRYARGRSPESRAADTGPMRLGDLLRWNMRLFLVCGGCQHSALIDVGKLGDRTGYDRVVPEVARRARCSKCGGNQVSAIVKSDRG